MATIPKRGATTSVVTIPLRSPMFDQDRNLTAPWLKFLGNTLLAARNLSDLQSVADARLNLLGPTLAINDTTHAVAVAGTLNVAGSVNVTASGVYEVAGIQVVGAQLPAIVDPAILTTQTAGAAYTTNEQAMLNDLRNDVTNLRATVEALRVALATHGLTL